MKSFIFAFAMIGYFSSPTAGWGQIFNRFRPEVGNWGYGGSDYAQQNREHLLSSLMADELEETTCEGRRCSSNKHCCAEHICVAFDGVTGSCMASSPQPEGSECTVDAECQAGLLCDGGACSPPLRKKGYYETCMSSAECDGSKGLCCQLVRRHRQTPRKVCIYFEDPLTCYGHVAVPEPAKRAEPAH